MSGRYIGVQRRRPDSIAVGSERYLCRLRFVQRPRIDALLLGSVAVALSACAIGEKVDGHQDTETGHADTNSSSDSSSTSIDSSDSMTSDTTDDTPEESCNDGIHNQAESDIDCGGFCPGCLTGEQCFSDLDCANQICNAGQCAEPSCGDGKKNQGESDVDCAGPCEKACNPGDDCGDNADCSSKLCQDGTCTTPNCTDGVHNGDESDVDCGGSCNGCEGSKQCESDEDCLSGACESGTCTDVECQMDSDCAELDGACVEGQCNLDTHVCVAAPLDGKSCSSGDVCRVNETCMAGSCQGGSDRDCSMLDDACGVGICDRDASGCTHVTQPVYFESFSPPDGKGPGDLGWTWQNPTGFLLWEIAPLPASPMTCVHSQPDPTQDHTPRSTDNWVAGTVVGGCTPDATHGFLCLTSPMINLSTAPSDAVFGFWRHLHTDESSQSGNYFSVEVFDTKSGIWTLLEEGYDEIDDPQWQRVTWPISSFTGPSFRARICYAKTANVAKISGITVDDVFVQSMQCLD